MLKWAKRSIKKKRGQLWITHQLNHQQFAKPKNVRMGSGKGKLQQRFHQVYIGQGMLTYSNINQARVNLVCQFFKKSHLKLTLVKKKC